MKMFLDINSAEERFKYIKETIEKQKSKVELCEDYYEGKQWLVSGVMTRAHTKVANQKNSGNMSSIKWGLVNNLTKKVVDEIVDYCIGISSENTIKTNNESFNKWLKKVKNDKLIIKELKDYLIKEKAILKYYINDKKERKISILDPEYVIFEEDELDCSIITGVLINQEISKELAYKMGYSPSIMSKLLNKGDDNYIYTEYWTNDLFYKLINGYIISSEPNYFEMIPVFRSEEPYEEEGYVASLINNQDVININYSLEIGINIINMNPLTVIELPKDASGLTDGEGKQIKQKELNVGPGAVHILNGGGKIYRVDSKGVTGEFIKSMDRYIEDFYAQAKITKLPTDFKEISGYAIKLLMSPTLKFIESIRQNINLIYENLFEIWYNDIGEGEELTSIIWSDIVLQNMGDKLDEALKLFGMNFPAEFIYKYLGLTDEQIAKLPKQLIAIEHNTGKKV